MASVHWIFLEYGTGSKSMGLTTEQLIFNKGPAAQICSFDRWKRTELNMQLQVAKVENIRKNLSIIPNTSEPNNFNNFSKWLFEQWMLLECLADRQTRKRDKQWEMCDPWKMGKWGTPSMCPIVSYSAFLQGDLGQVASCLHYWLNVALWHLIGSYMHTASKQ